MAVPNAKPTEMSSALPPHLDDETLSGLLDGDAEPAGAHLASCAECRARQELLAQARLLVAAPTGGELDDLTRRRLLNTALAAASDRVAAPARPRWYRQPAIIGVAAAVVAIVLAVPVIDAMNDSGRDQDASTAAPAVVAESGAQGAGGLPSALGDLGEVSEAALRQRYGTSATDATAMSDSAEGGSSPMYAPAPATDEAPPAAPTPTGGEAEKAAREESTAADGNSFDSRVGGAEPCLNAVMAGPGQGGSLRATATGTLRGTPVTVLVVDTDDGTKAFVAAREGCRILETYTL
jgi:hypothetical protein